MAGQVPPLTDERDLLLAYVAQQRDGIRNAAYGLTDEQARLTPVATDGARPCSAWRTSTSRLFEKAV